MHKKTFQHQQEQHLRHILKSNAGCSFYTHLGISNLHRERDFPLLYQDFCAKVPIFDAPSLRTVLSRMLGERLESLEHVFKRKNFVANQDVVGLVEQHGGVAPLAAGTLKELLKQDQKFWKEACNGFRKIKGKILEIHEDPAFVGSSSPLSQLIAQNRGGFGAKRFANIEDRLEGIGRSRYQRLHAYLDFLTEEGSKIEVLSAAPRTLAEMGLLLSQRERRFVTWDEICPNLKLFVHRDGSIRPYRRELMQLMSKLPNIDMREYSMLGPGAMSWQDDINIRNRLLVRPEIPIFYEFISLEHVLPDGRLSRNHKRLHAGQVSEGKDYLLLVTTPAGLLAYNTGEVVRILEKEPLRWMRRRKFARLNHFNEALPLDVVDDLIAEFNEALSAHQFLIREYLLGNDTLKHQPSHVFELSIPLAKAPQDLLQSMVNRFHTELALNVPTYKTAFSSMDINPPQITFVPLGTFASMPREFGYRPFDQSVDANQVKAILSRAWDQLSFQAQPLL
jgi:hypothetical protein